ncbi:glutamate-5-semialdehyde dehydrogenase [Christensenella intestinihominis]|uniref:glutamate-5-semialdehyde dehydrogenase n=1 Tax=Christensenella intestinihominis TaxID=1851429 RepID=UPI00082EA801|nr:glutamate-5-semialdehyde dehydrogenase [Christensenella intestinihominis]
MGKVIQVAEAAKAAKSAMNRLNTIEKNRILEAMAAGLLSHTEEIMKQNALDVEAAREKGRTPALIDRLALDKKRIQAMAQGLRDVAELPDPIGEIVHATKRPNGLLIAKQRVPMGVIGIIYEARPNVTADAVGLCLKTSNAVVLKGGSEAIHSNIAIADVLIRAGEAAGMPKGAVGLITDTSREAVAEMMKLNDLIDVLIPRGGGGLIRSVVQNATIPVIQTGVGNCHIYVDKTADFEMATAITVNAKTSRPAVCNAAESLLVHRGVATEFLPKVFRALKEKNVEIRGDAVCQKYGAIPATGEDYDTEFLDYIISVKVVDDVEEAIDHINRHGTGHSEAIITNDYRNAERFKADVDAAAVYVNASTRFTDGFEFGYGAEIGISTQKLHARGPMGLTELTTTKFVIDGDGQIR